MEVRHPTLASDVKQRKPQLDGLSGVNQLQPAVGRSSLTRKRSLVQSQYRPPEFLQVSGILFKFGALRCLWLRSAALALAVVLFLTVRSALGRPGVAAATPGRFSIESAQW